MIFCGLAGLTVLAGAVLFVTGGHVQQDEGWYLTAAREVFRGRMPYRDFFYTQGPLHPYLYGIPQLLFGPSLVAGRWTSFGFFALTLIAVARLAWRLGGVESACLAIALFGSSADLLWCWTLPLTHAAAGFFLIGGLALVCVPEQPRPARGVAGLAAIALGAGVRISLIGALAVATVLTALGDRTWRRRLLWTLAAAVAVACVYAPFVLASPDNFRFGVWTYHMIRTAQYLPSPTGVPAAEWWMGKWEFVTSLLHGYPVLVLAVLLATGMFVARPSVVSAHRRALWLILAVVVVTLGISALPHPVHATYVALLAPPAGVFAGVVLGRALASPQVRGWGTVLCAMVAGLLAFGLMQFAQDPQARRPEELRRIVDGARALQTAGLPPGPVLALENTMAVQMNRPQLPGFEMGPFAFWPYMPTPLAQRRHVVNLEIMCGYLERRVPSVVLLSRLDARFLTLPCGRGPMGDALLAGYTERPELGIDRFGQYGDAPNGGDALHVFVRR